MYRRAITLVELIMVIAIIMVLSSITFSLTRAGREGARQTSCAVQLKSAYQSIALYSSDFDGSQFPELHGLTYVTASGIGITNLLKPYGFTNEMCYCPSSSIRMKEALGSTYLWPIGIDPFTENGDTSPARLDFIRKEALMGVNLPIIECHIHDELYYAPAESDIDPILSSPFRILMRVDGSIKKGRVSPPRSSLFSDMTFEGR